MYLFHNSHEIKYRSPFGAAAIGSEVCIKLKVSDDIASCELICEGLISGALVMERTGDMFVITLKLPDTPGLLLYHFKAYSSSDTAVCGSVQYGIGGESVMGSSCGFQITVYSPDTTPEWFKEGIVYQIFPDRFFRGSDFPVRAAEFLNHTSKNPAKRVLHADWDDTPFYCKNEKHQVVRWPFFGGTLQGITEKLGYLKDLGISIIYLNPIFKAASNHRYDTADYMQIDPLLGDEASFRLLAESAKKLGIRIILDGVFSHTGADSIYFDRFGNYGNSGAYSNKDSKYSSWYSFETYPDKYNCWWGVEDLPNVNELEPSYFDYICRNNDSVVRHWLNAGASGWRLDVADELPDEFIQGVRTACAETSSDSLLMGEVWEDASNKVSYGKLREYFFGNELQSTMNYPLRDCIIGFLLGTLDAAEFKLRYTSIMENYPPECFFGALNLIGSHDRARILTVLGDPPECTDIQKAEFTLSVEKRSLAVSRLKLASVIQFAMPGAPCIYYGDEVGIQGFEDPYNRSTFPWGNEDLSLLSHYKWLCALRSGSDVLKKGVLSIDCIGEHVIKITRTLGKKSIVLFANRGIFESIDVKVDADSLHFQEIFSPESKTCDRNISSFTLAPLEFRIFSTL